MESQNSYSITPNEYQNIDTTKISTILLKDGTILQINNIISQNIHGNRPLNRNISDSSLPVNNPNNLSKVKKFNSFSANVNYKTKFNSRNQINGFYVTPIINGKRKLIAIKEPDIIQNIDLTKEKRHIENFIFKVSPKKYSYKPYKPPKRKHNLGITNTKRNYSSYSSFVNNKK